MKDSQIADQLLEVTVDRQRVLSALQHLYGATGAALQDDCLPLGSHCRFNIEVAHLDARNTLIALGENPDD